MNYRVPGFIITTFNDMHDLPAFVESFERSVNGRQYGVVVVDGGSTDGSKDFLNDRGYGPIVGPYANLAEALNSGIREFVGDLVMDEGPMNEPPHFTDGSYHSIFWIHPDMRFDEQLLWWEILQDYLDENPDVGKAGPNSYNLEGDRETRPGNTCPWGMPVQMLVDLELNANRSFPGDAGYRMKGPWFDENYKRCWGCEDWDLNRRIIDLGKKVMIFKGSKVWHKGMGSRSMYAQDRAEEMDNRGLYARKWGSFTVPV